MIHKEGRASIIIGIIVSVLLIGLAKIEFPALKSLLAIAVLLSLFIMILLFQFFRNPKRPCFQNRDQVLSPADGTVVVIEETHDREFLDQNWIQVSIFMSPLNVHVNRNPVSGIIEYVKYHPGKFLVAWHPKSSTENERTTIVYHMPNGKNILIRQIAGAMARRIVNYAKLGMQMVQGEQMGFIKFGSRVDVFLPTDTIITVKLGDKVKGGVSELAKFKQ